MEQVPKVLQQIIQDIRVKHYPRGQIMLYQGDTPLDVFILKDGIIKIYDIDQQGNEKILHLMKPFALFPFAFFSGQHKDEIHWFYSALTDCDVCTIPVEILNNELSTSVELSNYLMHWFSQEVHEILVRLSSLGKTNAHDKVIAALKFLAIHHAIKRRSDWWRVTFAVNHQLIADMTGVTRESAAMIMRELSEDKTIRNPRQTILEIHLGTLLKKHTPNPENVP